MFESALIDLEAKRQPQLRRRWLSLPLAIVLHLVGLTAFAFASYWSVGAVQEPQTNVAFIDVVLPPLPAGGGGHPKPTPPEPHPQTAPQPPTTPVQPETVPNRIPTPTTLTPVDVTPGPPSNDPAAPSGPGEGPGPGGPGFGPGPNGPGETPAIEDSAPQVLTAEMSRPVPLQRILPKYTEVARRAGIQGTVIVEAVIDEKGNATNVRILRGLPMGLDRSAMEAIQQTQFKPAMIGSRPVKVYYTLTVTFTIQR
ncbi:MAG TPA: energy transducer TonB [Thermoanaerobaculia bacterium]